MVIKGGACGRPGQLATHLERTDTNERARVVELRGVAARDLTGALKELDALGAGLRTDRTLYHASINTRADEKMTPEQWQIAIDRLEAKLGFTGQPRAVVEHLKEGREHVHIVWSRTDLERMRAIPDSHNYRKHEEVARALEREFGHARVQGAHAEREGQGSDRVTRPARTPSHAEMQQAGRSGLSPRQAREQITGIWERTDSGQAFAAALSDAGWTLARGDRRDFVVIDPHGGVHSLPRRVAGATAKDIRARLADIDVTKLPTVNLGKKEQRARAATGRATSPGPTPAPSARTGAAKPGAAPLGTGRPSVASQPGRARTTRALDKVAGGLFGATGKIADRIATGIEQLLGGGPSVPEHQPPKDKAMSAPEEKTPHEQVVSAEEARATRRQALMEKYGGAIETGREAEIEAGVRKRDEDRSR